MSSPLVWKVYTSTREAAEMVGAVKYAEDAAALAAVTAEAFVKVDGRIVWREGSEGQSAGDSYDWAAEVMRSRRAAHHREHTDRLIAAAERFIHRLEAVSGAPEAY
jgi:hypothetical protein